ARSINVEIAQAHTGQSVHVVEGTGDPLVHQLGGTIEGTVVVGVMSLGGGEVLGCPVDRGGGGVDDLAHAGGDGGLEDVEGTLHEDVDALPRPLGTERDSQGRLVKDVVAAGNRSRHRLPITDVSLQQPQAPGRLGQRCGQVFVAAADEVVQDAQLT